MTKPVMTTREAAKYLRIDRHALGRLVRSGQVQHKKIGNKWVFKREWLDEFLEKQEPGVTEPLTGKRRLELMAHRAASN